MPLSGTQGARRLAAPIGPRGTPLVADAEG